MNLPAQPQWGVVGEAGAVGPWGAAGAASADFQVGSIGFGPMWAAEDSMAESIVRISRQLEECHAQIAVYEAERSILLRERDNWRECAKLLADAVDYYHPALRDVEDGFSAERAAIARFDELEASK